MERKAQVASVMLLMLALLLIAVLLGYVNTLLESNAGNVNVSNVKKAVSGFVVLSQPSITLLDTELLQYQTLQAEIKANFAKPLTSSNVWIEKNGIKMPYTINVVKVDDTTYFVYAVITQPGNYVLKARISYYQDGQQMIDVIQQQFVVEQTNYDQYQDLLDFYSSNIQLLDTQQLAVALVLAKTFGKDASIFKQKLFELLQSQLTSLNDLAIARIALVLSSIRHELNDEQLNVLQYFIDYLKARQNNLVGVWQTTIALSNSDIALICHTNAGNITINDLATLDTAVLNNSRIVFADCVFINKTTSQLLEASQMLNYVNVTITKTYKDFAFEKQALFDISNDSFTIYVDACSFDAEADSSLLNFALSLFDTSCIANANDSLTLFARMINNVSYASLLASKQNAFGCFVDDVTFDKTLLIASAIAVNQLDFADAIKQKARSCLINNYASLTREQKALLLSMLEQPTKLLTVLPGALKVKTGNPFSITLHNQGAVSINASITANIAGFDLCYNITLAPGEIKTITITLPYITAQAGYINSFLYVDFDDVYKIPLYVTIEQTNITEVQINEQEFNYTFNYTYEEEQQINASNASISVKPTTINETVVDETTVELTIINNGSVALNNIQLSYSATLFGIVEFGDVQQQLMPSQSATISIKFTKPANAFDFYQGTITVTAESTAGLVVANIPVEIHFETTQQLLSCSELNGTKCKQNEECVGSIVNSADGLCCLGQCKPKRNKKLVAVGFIMLALALAIIIFIVIKHKPKRKSIEEVVKEIEEKYKAKQKSKI